MTDPLLDSFIIGFVAGGFLSACVFGALGCVLGYDAGARHIARLHAEAHGGVPTPPYGITVDDVDQTWGR